MSKSLVLGLPDEELDKDHSGQAAGGEQKEGAGGPQVVVAEEVELRGDEICYPPGNARKG